MSLLAVPSAELEIADAKYRRPTTTSHSQCRNGTRTRRHHADRVFGEFPTSGTGDTVTGDGAELARARFSTPEVGLFACRSGNKEHNALVMVNKGLPHDTVSLSFLRQTTES